MHRRIAKFLLLFAVAGNLAPLALAISAPPPHACCLRKNVHNCHGSPVAASEQLVLRSGNCCSQNCYRAVTTTRWAKAQPPVITDYVRSGGNLVNSGDPVSFSAGVRSFQSSRAPPHYAIP
jgi:hypothetical protein